MKLLRRNIPDIVDISFCKSIFREEIVLAARQSTRDIVKDIVKVRSSNVWGYTINIHDKDGRVGDVYVQFKDSDGSKGDIYVYYDVPVIVFRRWHSAQSKGHYFWKYIRNNYAYAKLTGDKRTHLKNGVGYRPPKPKAEVEPESGEVEPMEE